MRKTPAKSTKVIIVLAVHGAPPLDFPRAELAEFFGLHAGLGRGQGPEPETRRARLHELEAKMRSWPRTRLNDPFWAGSRDLAKEVQRESGWGVIVGFNEFCAPTLEEALGLAAARRPDKIIVATPMMTPGGEHAARDIPAAIGQARERYPGVEIIYAWPFPVTDIARFLASQLARFGE